MTQRYPASIVVLGLAVSLAAGGCRKNTEPDPTPNPTAWIKADPNPVPVPGPATGTTAVSWDTGDGSDAQVFVLTEDKKEARFSGGPKGSQAATWIVKGGRYEFILYAGPQRQKELARIVVTTR